MTAKDATKWCAFQLELPMPRTPPEELRFRIEPRGWERVRYLYVELEIDGQAHSVYFYPSPDQGLQPIRALLPPELAQANVDRLAVKMSVAGLASKQDAVVIDDLELGPAEPRPRQLSDDAFAAVLRSKRDDFVASLFWERVARRGNDRLASAPFEAAEQMLENTVSLPGYAPVRIEASGAAYWAVDPYHEVNWRTFFLSFEPLGYLSNAFRETKDTRFIDAAVRFVDDFLEHNPYGSMSSNRTHILTVWNEFVVALRLEYLLLLWETYPVSDEPEARRFLERLLESIVEHLDLLSSSGFYAHNQLTIHNNHALFQDRALLLGALALPELPRAEHYRRVAIERLRGQIEAMLTPEGVHVEHSPSYHAVLLSALVLFRDLTVHSDPAFSSFVDRALRSMLSFEGWLVRPNLTFPLLGDTGSGADLVQKHAEHCPDARCRFLLTRGAQGVAPTRTSTVFERSGYAILRDRFAPFDQVEDAVHLTLTAAFNSTIHKHRDDLALAIFAYGHDWLVDTGVFTYEAKHPYFEFGRSAAAHNVLRPIGLDEYAIDSHDPSKLRIEAYTLGSEYDHVRATSRLWPDVCLERQVLFIKPNVIQVIDRARGRRSLPYEQNWHFAPDAKIETDERTLTIAQGAGRMLVELADTPKLVSGQETPKPQGWYFPAYRQKVPNTVAVVERAGRELEMTTWFVLDPEGHPFAVRTLDEAKRSAARILRVHPELAEAFRARGCR